MMLVLPSAQADFPVEELPGRIAVYENGTPVLVYDVEATVPPDGVDPKYQRSSGGLRRRMHLLPFYRFRANAGVYLITEKLAFSSTDRICVA